MWGQLFKTIAAPVVIHFGKKAAKSFIEKSIATLLIQELKSVSLLTLFWIAIILLLSTIGWLFELERGSVWLIRFIHFSYTLIGLGALFSLYKKYNHHKWWIFHIKSFFNISIVNILNAISIPLIGWGFVYLFLSFLRSNLALSFW